jgi:hypothetical protein
MIFRVLLIQYGVPKIITTREEVRMDEAALGFLIGGGVCFLFLVFGIFIMIAGIRNRKKAEESTSWPSVQGTIIKAWVETQEHEDDDGSKTITHFPRWEYEFAVSGNTYTGGNISFGGTGGSSRESEAWEALEQYSLNSQVQVFYNPSNPEEAVLVPGIQGTMGSIIFGGVLTFIMFAIIVGLGIWALTS